MDPETEDPDRWIAAIVSRAPELGDLVIDPPGAVDPDERGRP